MEPSFLPVIPAVDENDDKREIKRAVKAALKQSLADPKCAASILRDKCNGSTQGHRVLDNAAAFRALTKAAPENLRPILETGALSMFEKTQCLDNVLDLDWERDRKTGKLTGQRSKRYLLRQLRAQNREASGASA